jgi:AcrR family transcriptional regulator
MKSRPTTRRYTQDARARSAEGTARRIVEAFLTRLMAQWYDEITLDRIAEDAGVTVQTVVRRFGGKEGLLARSVGTLSAQINAQRATPPGDIRGAVRNLVADYERTGDAVIRLLALEPRHPAIKGTLDFGRGEHRRWVSEAFANELGALDADPSKRVLDALVIATDVYAWKLLRRDMGRSRDATAATIESMIRAVLVDPSVFETLEEER